MILVDIAWPPLNLSLLSFHNPHVELRCVCRFNLAMDFPYRERDKFSCMVVLFSVREGLTI